MTVPRRGYRIGVPVSSAESPRSVAVLPFLGVDTASDALTVGFSESLIAELGRFAGLSVCQPQSVMSFESMGRDSIKAGREVGAQVVVDGSVIERGDRLRVSARLVRVDDGVVEWSERFEGVASDVFDLHDRVAQGLVEAMGLGGHGNAATGLDPEVQRLFLLARHHWHRFTPEDWRMAVDSGMQAAELDETFAPAHACVAASYCAMALHEVEPPERSFALALEGVDRCLALDQSVSLAHETKGAIALFHHWDWDEARRCLS